MARCLHEGCARCRTQPHLGCSCFRREPGTDDEPDYVPVRLAPVKLHACAIDTSHQTRETWSATGM